MRVYVYYASSKESSWGKQEANSSSFKQRGWALCKCSKSGVKSASDSQRLHSCLGCLIVSIFSASRFIEESRENAPFSSGKKKHAHLVLCVCTHPHNQAQMHAGGGLACKMGRQLYPLNGSAPGWCFCTAFFHFYNQNNIWQPAYLKRLLCWQLPCAEMWKTRMWKTSYTCQ